MINLDKKYVDYILGILIVLPTFYSMPHYLYILPVLFIFINNKYYNFHIGISNENLFLLSSIFILSLINYYLLGYSKISSLKDYIPYFVFYIAVFLIAFNLNKNILYTILIVLSIESFFVILERIIGINTVFINHIDFRNDLYRLGDYSARTFGLSDGINSMGIKILIAYLIYSTIINKENFNTILLKILILTAAYINYSRAALVAIGIFIFVEAFKDKKYLYFALFLILSISFIYDNYNLLLVSNNIETSLYIKHLISLVIELLKISILAYIIFYILIIIKRYIIDKIGLKQSVIIALLVIITYGIVKYSGKNLTKIGVSTFTKYSGRNPKDVLSYRDIIYKKNILFIKKHYLFGNNSHKHKVYLKAYNTYEHAHNSFLEFASNNGIIISILWFLFILRNINRNNFIYLLAILILSMTQYGIFWGISLLDIIFIYYLCFYSKTNKIINKQA